MTEGPRLYKHDASDKKLDQAATAEKPEAMVEDPDAHTGHDPAKIRKHDDAGKDRLFEGRVQHDDADKQSDRNRLEKDVDRHNHTADEVTTMSDKDAHPKRKK